MRTVLRKSLQIGDWEQQQLFGKSVSPIKSLAQLQHGHISARQLKPELDGTQWERYFKFAIVRNPFDRFVSVCAFLNRQSDNFSPDANKWMKDALTRPQFRQRLLVRPQVEQLKNERGEIELNYIGRYEQLQNSMDVITSQLGLDQEVLPIKNASRHDHYKQYYDDHLYDAVASLYSEDLIAFNYSF